MSDEKIRIVHAPQEKIKELSFYVEAVLDALGHPKALVTDLSTVGDFLLGRRQGGWGDKEVETYLNRLFDYEYPLSSLARSIEEGEYIWSLAARLRSRAERMGGGEPLPVLAVKAGG